MTSSCLHQELEKKKFKKQAQDLMDDEKSRWFVFPHMGRGESLSIQFKPCPCILGECSPVEKLIRMVARDLGEKLMKWVKHACRLKN